MKCGREQKARGFFSADLNRISEFSEWGCCCVRIVLWNHHRENSLNRAIAILMFQKIKRWLTRYLLE
jgi:hypothetical protein